MGILAATVVIAAPIQTGTRPLSAYYQSTIVEFEPETATTHAVAALGPWTFGPKLSEEKPLDKRLNLYVVLPGRQYHSAGFPEYDHNLVVNALAIEKARGWDIYWCFILDVRLTDDLRSEHDLLAAAQQSFKPADLFDVEDIPAHEALAERAGVQEMADLKHFRHKDGSLPRLLILPAHLAVTATVQHPEEQGRRAESAVY